MNVKDPQIVIDPKTPFANCKLGREQYADALESIVSNTPDGCVIALNGAWGTGKTTFVRMWEQQLKNHGFKTAYFNAWETDFVSDPLVALIGELQKIRKGKKGRTKFKRVVKTGGEIIAGAIPAVAQALLAHYKLEKLGEYVKDTLSNAGAIISEEIKQYEEENRSLNSFRDALSNWVKSLDSDKPLVFFIDELDRCNPHYAVRILERVKHLFSLSRIVFVLCIDKEQLGHSICGYYGSDKINAQEYLRRFIDVDYNLPEPDYDAFFNFLYSESNLENIIKKAWEASYPNLIKDHFSVARLLFNSCKLSLRQMSKMMTHIKLTIKTFKSERYLDVGVLILLVYLRYFHHEIYRKIEAHEYNIQTLVNDIEKFLPNSVFQTTDEIKQRAVNEMNCFISELLVMYNEAEDFRNREKIYNETANGEIELLFETSLIDKEKIIISIKNPIHGRFNVLQNAIKHIEILYKLHPDPVGEK